ncbi:MAG: c-type cytochrome [Thiohalomonadales bacterium]
MKNTVKIILVAFIALFLFACSSSNDPAPSTNKGAGTGPTDPVVIAKQVAAGKEYYMSECAVCHKAGADDTTNAFSSVDLVVDYQGKTKAAKDTYIVPDMHTYGLAGSDNHNLMGRFDLVPAQSVADLKAYFETALK